MSETNTAGEPIDGVPVLTDQIQPPPYDFPWQEIRDFISTSVSLMLAQQNHMIGSQMVAKETNENKRKALVEQLLGVGRVRDQLNLQTQALNDIIEKKLQEFEGKRPRLILPR